jgi:hypothetical protein
MIFRTRGCGAIRTAHDGQRRCSRKSQVVRTYTPEIKAYPLSATSLRDKRVPGPTDTVNTSKAGCEGTSLCGLGQPRRRIACHFWP